jgi:hypothetical protein
LIVQARKQLTTIIQVVPRKAKRESNHSQVPMKEKSTIIRAFEFKLAFVYMGKSAEMLSKHLLMWVTQNGVDISMCLLQLCKRTRLHL